MMTNLFSMFDPSTSLFSTAWLIAIPVMMIIKPPIWKLFPISMKFLLKMILNLKNEVKFSLMKTEKSTEAMIITLFVSILLMNLLALFPQNFSMTSHLTVNLPIAFTMWLAILSKGWFNHPNHMLAHLVPQGTPAALMFFMVMIEMVSNLIRPITLCVRLTANLIAGHLLMTLLGNLLSSLSTMSVLFMLISPIALTILETAVAFIQAYVFMTLITMYTTEIN